MILNYILLVISLNSLLVSSIIRFSYIWVGLLPFSIIIDNWSVFFFGLLGVVSSVVFTWSYYYMGDEEFYTRFILLVSIFVTSIVVLIFSANLYVALIGWDGLGVSSFLLVIYYKTRKAIGAGMITAITNRLGDCFLFVVLGLTLFSKQSLGDFYIIVAFLIFTSITKRAIVPFSSWLPSAIAAPTPVSALVHSSTLVTAGVWLLLRFNDATPEWLLPIGRITILIAGLCACVEMDFKKVVALSTLSQLGVIIIAVGIWKKDFAFFHLLSHASFKALLFLCVGAGIHTFFGTQDFRSFAENKAFIFWPVSLLIVANLALLGFPYLSGFFRKDSILESFYGYSFSFLILYIFILGVGTTTAYRIKIMNSASFRRECGSPRGASSGGFRWQIKVSIVILAFCSVTAGFFLRTTMSLHFTRVSFTDKVIPLIFVLLGAVVGQIITNFRVVFLRAMWNLRTIFQKVRHPSAQIYRIQKYDSGWTEYAGGKGHGSIIFVARVASHPIFCLSILVIWFSTL